MTRVACIADTSAILHIRDIVISTRTLLDWLREEFQGRLRVSAEVYDELNRNRGLLGSAAGITMSRLRPMRLTVQDVEQHYDCVFDRHTFPNGDGERHNLCLSVQLVRAGRDARQVIFLCDDDAACTAATDVLDSYRIGQVWTSFDLLLFLFFRHYREVPDATRQFSEALEGLVHNILSDVNPPTTARGRRAEDRLRRMQAQIDAWTLHGERYSERILRTKGLLDCLP